MIVLISIAIGVALLVAMFFGAMMYPYYLGARLKIQEPIRPPPKKKAVKPKRPKRKPPSYDWDDYFQ